MNSPHLDRIIAREGIVHTQAVMVDIEKCSRRKTSARLAVVKNFNALVASCLEETVASYAKQFGDDGTTALDVAKSQAGDSVAVMFTFSGVHDAHFRFAKTFITKLNHQYKTKRCEDFDRDRFCNCCPELYYVRIGMDDGPAQVFRDINGCYNVIGTVIDMAFRIMNFGDGQQILMSDHAYKTIVDLETEPDLEVNHRVFRDIHVKHGVALDIYQYTAPIEGLCGDRPQQMPKPLADILNTLETT